MAITTHNTEEPGMAEERSRVLLREDTAAGATPPLQG
jgi:hypothetical protein